MNRKKKMLETAMLNVLDLPEWAWSHFDVLIRESMVPFQLDECMAGQGWDQDEINGGISKLSRLWYDKTNTWKLFDIQMSSSGYSIQIFCISICMSLGLNKHRNGIKN